MIYREYGPSPPVARFVECFWHLRRRATGGWEPIYPDGCAEIIFNLQDPAQELRCEVPVRRPRHFVHGQLVREIRVRSAPRTELVGIRLRPWAASPLLGVPGELLTGRAHELEAVASELAQRLLAIVESDTAIAGRIRSLDETLRSWIRERSIEVPSIAPVVGRLLSTAATIGDVSAWTGWSVRTTQRRFHAEIGLSPKRLQQIGRFVRFLRLSDLEREAPLAELATAAGYYDQPHLHRDVRRFTGTTPSLFRARRRGPFDRFYTEDRSARLIAV